MACAYATMASGAACGCSNGAAQRMRMPAHFPCVPHPLTACQRTLYEVVSVLSCSVRSRT